MIYCYVFEDGFYAQSIVDPSTKDDQDVLDGAMAKTWIDFH